MAPRTTLAQLALALASGRTSSAALTQECLERIADPRGEGARVFTRTYPEQALAAAAASDALRACGITPSPLAGIPICVKDLFDLAGEPTTAGSPAFPDLPRAATDAAIVRQLRAAGAIILGRTNMTEAAYSTLGLNPHYGTPANPADAARIPGGSSCGAAAAVGYGMCAAAIGTDTAGSVRIPAALCGLTGLKPTQERVPLEGVFPLSHSFDSVGPIGVSVTCCVLLDAVMAGRAPPTVMTPPPLAGLRVAVPTRYLTEALDATVQRAFDRALLCLKAAGAEVAPREIAVFAAPAELEAAGKLLAAEAYSVHRPRLATHGERYDPRVRARLEAAAALSAVEVRQAREARRHAIATFTRDASAWDVLVAPTVAVVAPLFREVERDADYRRINAVLRRNTAVVNVLDACALSLPCQAVGELPVGLMVVAGHGQDERLHGAAAAIEAVLRLHALG
jgi:aspartyl-tRNA(Asn)/glutamyl-tRNA(Gln) amidotransferase subunit A